MSDNAPASEAISFAELVASAERDGRLFYASEYLQPEHDDCWTDRGDHVRGQLYAVDVVLCVAE